MEGKTNPPLKNLHCSKFGALQLGHRFDKYGFSPRTAKKLQLYK